VVMSEAPRRQGVPVDRISFVDALRWLLDAILGDELPDWWSTRGVATASSPASENAGRSSIR
jgi:hypothetical protein